MALQMERDEDAHALMVLDSGYLHADETIIKVLDSDKKEATHRGYYWVYQCHEQKLVLFDYRTGRGAEGPQSVLKDYQGYLQTDGYVPGRNPHYYLSGGTNEKADVIYFSTYFPKEDLFSFSRSANFVRTMFTKKDGRRKQRRNIKVSCTKVTRLYKSQLKNQLLISKGEFDDRDFFLWKSFFVSVSLDFNYLRILIFNLP
ncbi:MAG: transposase [Ginsengibacter sp.]